MKILHGHTNTSGLIPVSGLIGQQTMKKTLTHSSSEAGTVTILKGQQLTRSGNLESGSSVQMVRRNSFTFHETADTTQEAIDQTPTQSISWCLRPTTALKQKAQLRAVARLLKEENY